MEELSKQKVFITGINGFTGKHLEAYLTNIGFEIYGSDLDNPLAKNHFSCNILSETSLFEVLNSIKPDFIIHLAAISFVAAKDQNNMYNVNVFGTLNLLNAIDKLSYKPKKVLIASSAAVYGNIEGVLNEQMCPQPVNHYGNSKLVMENMTKAYFSKQNIIITRPFNYTGIGQENHFVIPKIVNHYKQKKSQIELGNIDVFREFNDVDFVVKCYSELIMSKVDSEIVNVCSGNELSINNIIDVMNHLAGYSIKIVVNPELVRKNEIKLLKGSSKKLFSIVGNFTDEYDIKDTLYKIFDYP